jgi:GntR family transcriptional regulator, vanillate catabolism transcriptional regulator
MQRGPDSAVETPFERRLRWFLNTIPSGGTLPADSRMSDQTDRTSQTMRALLRLRELLLSGEFAPGERMSELPLVERLGVSRTPLRLALSALEHEGLLRVLPGGGYVVREFTRADIDDSIELRGVLEGTAARFAAERGVTKRELRAMREIVDQTDEFVHRADYESFERYVGLNERFHALLHASARSPLLERALEGILSLPFASPSAFVLTEAELPESREVLVVAQNHHRGLIESIERREGARAEAIAREHARLARTNLDIVLRHREVLDRVPGGSLIALPDGADEAVEATVLSEQTSGP